MKPIYNKNQITSYLYVYQYKDHLGNIRLSYADCDGDGSINLVTEILEENNYYPFGLKHKGYNEIANSCRNEEAEKYKYNGKEFQDELGLDWYDYHARNYDPALGRWLNVDPLAENSRRWTPYNYAYNNPIYFIDPDGMQAVAGLKTDELDDIIKFMNDGSVERIKTDDKFDTLTNEDGTLTKQIDFKDGKSQIGQIQEYEIAGKEIQYMLIQDNEVARDVFEFAASTTANNTSNAEFGMDMYDFEDGLSMNLFQTGEIAATGFPNVTPSGVLTDIDLGNNHLIKDSNWIESNHSHPGGNGRLTPSGFDLRNNKYIPNQNVVGDRVFMTGKTFRGVEHRTPQNAYLYQNGTYIKYDANKAEIIGNRK